MSQEADQECGEAPAAPLSVLQQARARGNELFSAERYEEAIEAYTVGLDDEECEADPQRYLVLGNRALCHELIGDFTLSLRDAADAVEAQPTYAKGWWRLATACYRLDQRADVVLYYLNKLLELEPSHREGAELKAAITRQQQQQAAAGDQREQLMRMMQQMQAAAGGGAAGSHP